MLRPRTIRGQLVAGLIAFEIVLVVVFAFFVVQEHSSELRQRELHRLEYQSNMVSLMAQVAIAENRPDILKRTLNLMMGAPSVQAVQFTDVQGRTILSSDSTLNGGYGLTDAEKQHLQVEKVLVFHSPGGQTEAVAPVIVGGVTKALVWIYPSERPRQEEVYTQIRLTIAFAIVGCMGCVFLAEFLARSITRPLSRLLHATRRLIRNPEDTSTLPMTGPPPMRSPTSLSRLTSWWPQSKSNAAVLMTLSRCLIPCLPTHQSVWRSSTAEPDLSESTNSSLI